MASFAINSGRDMATNVSLTGSLAALGGLGTEKMPAEGNPNATPIVGDVVSLKALAATEGLHPVEFTFSAPGCGG